jgi:hypothetical protein
MSKRGERIQARELIERGLRDCARANEREWEQVYDTNREGQRSTEVTTLG